MAPAQKPDSKEPKSSTNRNDASDTPGNGRGAGLWIFFPLVTVVIGIVVGLSMNAEPGKQAASETPAVKKGELSYLPMFSCFLVSTLSTEYFVLEINPALPEDYNCFAPQMMAPTNRHAKVFREFLKHREKASSFLAPVVIFNNSISIR